MISDEAVIQWLNTIALGSVPLDANNVGLAIHALEMLRQAPPEPRNEPAIEGEDA